MRLRFALPFSRNAGRAKTSLSVQRAKRHIQAMTKGFDVVIAGGGLNGLAMAVALAGAAVRLPLSVCVIDAADPESFRAPQFDGRAGPMSRPRKRQLTPQCR